MSEERKQIISKCVEVMKKLCEEYCRNDKKCYEECTKDLEKNCEWLLEMEEISIEEILPD